ncbi:hypothetical protein TNCV_5129491 [Trichonephila clavipes]|nr:hypothetical protein TNCV_5129491 [Trichonephila clavipes]
MPRISVETESQLINKENTCPHLPCLRMMLSALCQAIVKPFVVKTSSSYLGFMVVVRLLLIGLMGNFPGSQSWFHNLKTHCIKPTCYIFLAMTSFLFLKCSPSNQSPGSCLCVTVFKNSIDNLKPSETQEKQKPYRIVKYQ